MPTNGLPDMVADRRALSQILLNLISNAIRFTDRGGKVTVGARADAGYVTFTVEDNGVGINDEDLARVGEPYFQARASYDRRHSGTGLGLSIVKGLVRLHGGEIDIRSRVGKGTRVECPAATGLRTHEAGRRAAGRFRSMSCVTCRKPTNAPSRPLSFEGEREENGAAQIDSRVKKSA